MRAILAARSAGRHHHLTPQPRAAPELLIASVADRDFRETARTLTPELNAMMGRADETEIISYFDRMKVQGEYNAMLWLRNRNKLR